ncbi:hypothetical protein D3C76_1408580 [compost metagenome]
MADGDWIDGGVRDRLDVGLCLAFRGDLGTPASMERCGGDPESRDDRWLLDSSESTGLCAAHLLIRGRNRGVSPNIRRVGARLRRMGAGYDQLRRMVGSVDPVC